jgi:hypothetical protein
MPPVLSIPRSIDDISWPELIKETHRIRSFTSPERGNYFREIIKGIGSKKRRSLQAYLLLTPSFYMEQQFHREAGLRYSDKRNENWEIILVSLASLAELELK